MLKVLILHIIVEIVIEVRVIENVYVDMVVGSGERFAEERIMLLGVCGMGRIQVL